MLGECPQGAGSREGKKIEKLTQQNVTCVTGRDWQSGHTAEQANHEPVQLNTLGKTGENTELNRPEL